MPKYLTHTEVMAWYRARQRHKAPPAEPVEAGLPEGEEPGPAGIDGYRVEKNGTWYSLIGPDGEKVGTSQRSEADAWALLEDR